MSEKAVINGYFTRHVVEDGKLQFSACSVSTVLNEDEPDIYRAVWPCDKPIRDIVVDLVDKLQSTDF